MRPATRAPNTPLHGSQHIQSMGMMRVREPQSRSMSAAHMKLTPPALCWMFLGWYMSFPKPGGGLEGAMTPGLAQHAAIKHQPCSRLAHGTWWIRCRCCQVNKAPRRQLQCEGYSSVDMVLLMALCTMLLNSLRCRFIKCWLLLINSEHLAERSGYLLR